MLGYFHEVRQAMPTSYMLLITSHIIPGLFSSQEQQERTLYKDWSRSSLYFQLLLQSIQTWAHISKITLSKSSWLSMLCC